MYIGSDWIAQQNFIGRSHTYANVAPKPRGKKTDFYCQTLENRSSFPPNPPPGLPVPRLKVGAALVHPPKSSSATTVGVDLVFVTAGAPQPPISLAVNVSGTFMVVDWALEAETGSGVLQASLPHASKLAENMLLTLVVLATGCGAGWAERLNMELGSTDGVGVGLGFGTEVATGVAKSKRSPEEGGGGGGTFDTRFVFCEKLMSPWSLDDLEATWPGGLGVTLEEILSKKRPPPRELFEGVTLGAARVDLAPPRLPRFEKGDGLSCCFLGEDGVAGKLKPLKASVNPPKFEDCGCWGVYPNEGEFPC